MNEHIEREHYMTESRDNAARGRIRQRQLTREERLYRKRRTVYLLVITLWALFLIAILLLSKPEDIPEAEPSGVSVQTISAIVESTPEPEPTPEPKPEPEPVTEPEKEAVPMEFDPVRDDIPLDAETQRLLFQACGETGIVYELALAVVWQETDFRNVIGDGGDSLGYMQVQPRWHEERMERLGVTDLMDPYSNFLVGCDFLAELFSKYDIRDALTKYNSGKSGNSQYARDVLNYMNFLTMEEF